MLYHLLYALHTDYTFLNVFRYITFRTIYASITALALSYFLGPMVIRNMRKLQVKQVIRENGPQTHLSKAGTPTMGGIQILGAFIVCALLWTDLASPYVWIILLVTVCYGMIGFADDYLKVVKKNTDGLSARGKLAGQISIGLITGVLIYRCPEFDTHVTIPFFKHMNPDLGIFFIPFAALVIVGTSNAVNLTDGLDGLAIGPVITTAATYMVFTYVAGHAAFAKYLHINFIRGCGDITILCGILCGAGFGFLWFNAYPAQLFMGDVGSLSLGGILGTIAVLAKQEIMLVIVGGIFVVEALSVMLQVGYFKMTGGKRIFRMAPLHHHYEQRGWPENKVIVRFWIVSIMLALIALSSLKIR
ncbi:MAG: phospho-N-acetylmuramoyl-pentapeptide-transferase [Deltaproteobacteria bacterium]|nr:MAG: phospho-N-acetylmuramoyl-pentapeptide-transferase [Deltaproteobacteria bacterium]